MVRTEDGGTAVTAAGSIVTQATSDEAPSVAEAKANDNESFYFVNNDKSISASADDSEETSVSVPAPVHPGDTEPEVEPDRQDEGMEDKMETAVETSVIEASTPTLTQSSPSDPNSLLTSVRLVIGALNQIAFHRLFVDNACTLLLLVLVFSLTDLVLQSRMLNLL